MWIDSHCHLHHEKIAPSDVDGLILRARQAGVSTLLTVGTCLADTALIGPLLEKYASVYGSVGIHPHEADPTLQIYTLEKLEALLRQHLKTHTKMIALGETGLDFYHGPRTADSQKACFDLHLRMAQELNLPVIVHSRDAEEDIVPMLQKYRGKVRGVIHCFSGSLDFARAVLDVGFDISFSGVITFAKADDLRQVIPHVPLERILVETDTPYLAPVPYRGRSNEPAYVVETGRKLAEIYGIPVEELARQTALNFQRLFLTPHEL